MPNMPQCQSGKVAETQRTAGCRLAVPLANDNRALVVDTVNLKDILCDIEADPDRGHGDLSLNNNAAPPILSEAGSAVAEGVHPIWIRTISSARADTCPHVDFSVEADELVDLVGDWALTFAAAACDLVRLPKLIGAT